MPETLGAKDRILIVDDNEDIRRDFEKILGGALADATELDALDRDLFGDAAEELRVEENFELHQASQGREGFEMVRRAVEAGRPFSIAFVDVRMPPGWDGVETVAKMWEVDPNLQVVLCTAYSDYSFEQTTEALGGTDRLVILRKPFENIEVRQLAHSLSQKWVIQRQLRLRIDELEAANVRINDEMRERRRAEAALRDAEKLQAIGRLAAGIAHEIRNPLQIISMNLEALAEVPASVTALVAECSRVLRELVPGPEDAEQTERRAALLKALDAQAILGDFLEAHEEAREGVRMITDTIETMNQFSYRGVVGKDAVDLNEALRSAIKFTRAEYCECAELVVAYGEIPPVQCNRTEIVQVFLNLIVNAAHAISEHNTSGSLRGVIRVRTSSEDGYVVTAFEDTGGGIPSAILDKIFDPFFTTKEIGKGTGQGLAISYRIIVESHGGRIDVDSRPGVGTTFFVRLPI